MPFGFYVLLRHYCKGLSCIAGFLVRLLLLLPFKFGGGSIGSSVARTSVFQFGGVKIEPTITAFDFTIYQNICCELVIPGLLLGSINLTDAIYLPSFLCGGYLCHDEYSSSGG